MAISARQRLLVSAVCASSLFLLSACGGDESSSDAAQNSEQRPSPGNPATPPGKTTKPYAYENTRFAFANGCYNLQADGRFISESSGQAYGVTSDARQAARFYLRPTELGAYLLMSDYQREAGQAGQFELLGIRDPGGEFLDTTGMFIGELSYLVAGLGDTTNLLLDPIAPLGGLLRELGESLEYAGDQLANTDVRPALATVDSPNDLAVWKLNKLQDSEYTLTSAVTGLMLGASEDGLTLSSPSLRDTGNAFTFEPAQGCADYPEADLSLEVADKRGPAVYLKEVDRFKNIKGIDNDDIFGYVDTHSHISAYEFIGGRVNYGAPFHKFGVTHALENCEVAHGPWGTTGFVELVTSGSGPHDTQGWPTFNDWPRYNSLQHHQSYYRWLERAHYSGMKILVNHYLQIY